VLRQVSLCIHAVATTPAETLGAVIHLPQRHRPSPLHGRVGFRIGLFEACSAFTPVTACMLAKSPKATLYIEVLQRLCYLHRRFDCYRLERPVAGRELHSLKTCAFHGTPCKSATPELHNNPPIRGGQMSNWTRHRILRNCRTIFQGAVTWQLISKNPFRNLSAPRLVTRLWHYLKPDEYRTLLEAAPSLRWKAFYALAYTAALRVGELLSLTWSDIDFETGEVRIENRPATFAMPPFFIKDNEARSIPLPKHTLDILTDLHTSATEGIPYVLLDERQYGIMAAKWRKYREQNRPWRNQDMANNTLREFRRHLKWAGIKAKGSLSIHTLRKSCGQNWANYLPINVVKELMGHSSISTTQKFYSQVDGDHRAKAAQVMDSLVSGTDVGPNEAKKTDARLTPEADLEQNCGRRQV